MIARWTKRLGLWGWLFVTTGGITLALGVAIVVVKYRLDRGIAARIAGIRARGEPVTMGELQRLLPPIPIERDATRTWIAGFAANQPVGRGRFDELVFVGPFATSEAPLPGSDWNHLALAEEYLSDRAEALASFHAAAEMDAASRLPGIFGPTSLDIQSPRRAAQLLRLEALVHAHKGEAQPTAASLHAALAAGRACEGEPFFFPFMMRRGIHSAVIEQLLRLLPTLAFDDETLRRFQTTLRSIDYRPQQRLALVGERAYGLGMLQDPTLMIPPSEGPPAFLLPWLGHVSTPDFLDTMTDAVAVASLPWPEAIEGGSKVARPTGPPDSYSNFLYWYIAPGIEPHLRATVQSVSLVRLADMALAIERFRLHNGRLPESIDDLAPDFLPSVPLDPFTGKPLRYRRTSEGFVVYSVGEDRKDDGGLLDEFQTRDPDLGYRIRYPKEAPDATTE